jgi:hypothetical protein
MAAQLSTSQVELTVGDAVGNNPPSDRPGSLSGVQLRIPVRENVQLRYLGSPTAIDFTVELDHELHSHRLPPMVRMRGFGNGVLEESPR